MARFKGGLIAAAALTLLAAGLMLALFGAGEESYRELAHLPSSQVAAGLGHARAEGQIDINTATVEELDALPGIGPVRAEAIVEWREANGPFLYPEDLIQVPGIGETTLAGLLEHITVGGE